MPRCQVFSTGRKSMTPTKTYIHKHMLFFYRNCAFSEQTELHDDRHGTFENWTTFLRDKILGIA